jgi:hypothetical protein
MALLTHAATAPHPDELDSSPRKKRRPQPAAGRSVRPDLGIDDKRPIAALYGWRPNTNRWR